MLTKFIFVWVLNWLPLIFSGTIILILIINHLFSSRKYLRFLKKLENTKLIYILIGATLLFDTVLSILQYVTWHSSPLSRFFLPPYQPINYFLSYILFHFWLAGLLVLILALAFYLFFKLAKKYRDDLVSSEELPLILLAGLLVGWPNFIILVPLFFLLTLIFSVVNLLVFKKKKNTLLYPLIISLVIVFLIGSYLVEHIFLSALVI